MMSRLQKTIESLFDQDFEDVEKAPSFRELENWDSLTYIKLVVALQAEFAIELTPQEIQQINSVSAIQEILKARGLDS